MGMITATQSLSKSYLPPDARLLVVGAGSVGKSALAKAIQRLAKRVRVQAETHALPHSHHHRSPPILSLSLLRMAWSSSLLRRPTAPAYPIWTPSAMSWSLS